MLGKEIFGRTESWSFWALPLQKWVKISTIVTVESGSKLLFLPSWLIKYWEIFKQIPFEWLFSWPIAKVTFRTKKRQFCFKLVFLPGGLPLRISLDWRNLASHVASWFWSAGNRWSFGLCALEFWEIQNRFGWICVFFLRGYIEYWTICQDIWTFKMFWYIHRTWM